MNCEKCGSDCYHIETGNSSTGQIAIIHCEHCEWRSEIEQLKSENQKLKAAIDGAKITHPDWAKGLSPGYFALDETRKFPSFYKWDSRDKQVVLNSNVDYFVFEDGYEIYQEKSIEEIEELRLGIVSSGNILSDNPLLVLLKNNDDQIEIKINEIIKAINQMRKEMSEWKTQK